MKKVIIINGPNLNLLGIRQTNIYGGRKFDDFLLYLQSKYKDIKLEYFQSNHEGELIDKLHQTGFSYDGIILNAGGYTHTSVSLGDAVAAIKSPVVEVHISNIFAREEFRKTSYISEYSRAVISGCGLEGYEYALLSLLQ